MAERAVCGFFMPETPSVMHETPYGKSSEEGALSTGRHFLEELGSRLSFLGMFYGLGALGIPSLLGVLSEHYSFETILQGIGIIMLAGILFCIPVHFPAPKQAQGFPVKEGLGLLKESSLLLLSSILFFQSGIEGVCNNWSTSYFGHFFIVNGTMFSFIIPVTITTDIRIFVQNHHIF